LYSEGYKHFEPVDNLHMSSVPVYTPQYAPV